MRVVFILILSFLFNIINAQEITKFNTTQQLNTRSAKIDSLKYDWYYKGECNLQFDSIYDVYLMYNRERDNAVLYYSYEVKFTSKYFSSRRFFDTEKNIDITNSSVYYPLVYTKNKNKYQFKTGYDFSFIDSTTNHNIYTSLSYERDGIEWIYLESAFFDELLRFEYRINPTFMIFKNMYIGVGINGILIKDKFKWNAGGKIILKIK